MAHPRRLFIDPEEYEEATERGYIKLREVKTYGISYNDIKHYLLKVLRYSVGDRIDLLSTESLPNEELKLECRLVNPEQLEFEVVCEHSFLRKVPQTARIDVFFPLLRGDSTEEVIDGLTQLGVSNITIFLSLNSYQAGKQLDKTSKLERFLRRAYWSAIQARRWWLPKLELLTDFKVLVETLRGYKLVLLGESRAKPLYSLELSSLTSVDRVAIITGPEKGLSETELNGLEYLNSIRSVSLSDLILTARLAPIVFVSKLELMLSDLVR